MSSFFLGVSLRVSGIPVFFSVCVCLSLINSAKFPKVAVFIQVANFCMSKAAKH